MTSSLNSTMNSPAFSANSMEEQSIRPAREQLLPKALFICCSDSPINQTLLHRTNPGDLFILKNEGNVVPAYGTADGVDAQTIDFAVNDLGIGNIIVCGHSRCKALQAPEPPQEFNASPEESLCGKSRLDWMKRLDDLVAQENVLIQLENLKTYPFIAEKLARDLITLNGWVYKIETGVIYCYRPQERRFLPWIPQPK
jgi:carbonic anhydrase